MCNKLENETHLISQMFRRQLHTIISMKNDIRIIIKTPQYDNKTKIDLINKKILESDSKLETVTLENLSQQ